MKKALLPLFSMILFLGINAAAIAQHDTENLLVDGAKIEFDKNVHDYGTVKYASNEYCTFEFTNTGNAPLIIAKAEGSCGCTVPTWPKEPIAPGKSAIIKVKYNTKKVGVINKSVKITSNAVNAPTKVLRIKGNVLAKETDSKPTSPVIQSGAPVAPVTR